MIDKLIKENQQHIFTEEQVERLMGDVSDCAIKGFQVPEPRVLYNTTTSKSEKVYIVRRGEGPHEWVKEITSLIRALHSNRERILISKGRVHTNVLKSVMANVCRTLPRAKRNTLVCMDLHSGDVFKVIEVVYE